MKMQIAKQTLPEWLCHNPDHKTFKNGEFWKTIPGWKSVTPSEFGDYRWQLNHSVTGLGQIKALLQQRTGNRLLDDIQKALDRVPMTIRITPYIFALIDWDNPIEDPLRRQFLPIGSQLLENHPFCLKDSLHEEVDSPVRYLTHRYPDKVLFLTLSICPHYCSYCTRNRLIGGSTQSRAKQLYGPNTTTYQEMFDYIRTHDRIEDVVISGGDVSLLKPDLIRRIGETLLDIDHVRRIRYATKSLAVFPMKLLSDDEWFRALIDVSNLGRKRDKQVCIHTHFSSPREITIWSQKAATRLFQEGMTVRNQTVFQAGVNDDERVMELTIKQLGFMNVQPYYVFTMDMVPGCEQLRTTLQDAMEMEKAMRGLTSGFNLPTFACDLPTGGGKRPVASYEHYDPETGISVWRSPAVKPGKVFFYFDPIRRLSQDVQAEWHHPGQRKKMLKAALARVSSDLKPDAFYDLSEQRSHG